MYLLSDGSGYPVLFIHGMPTSSSLWGGVIARLREVAAERDRELAAIAANEEPAQLVEAEKQTA